jgi:tRNA (mo5U34)-methyltransferase
MDPVTDHQNIVWWHSIDLGDGVVTSGQKSASVLAAEFDRLQLTTEQLAGKRLLDIGCADGYMSLRCEQLGADVVSIDGVLRDGLRYVKARLAPKFKFYCLDMMSPSFLELGRFDIILYLGVLYHTMYPFEQILRLAHLCNKGTLFLVESAYFDLAGFENEPTLFYDYDGRLIGDPSSPVFPSVKWIVQTLGRVGFGDVTELHREPWAGNPKGGRVTIRASYNGGGSGSPFLYAYEQLLG